MQEAARTCPASAPCPDHDARTRVCAGAENRTRNALNATLTTLELLVGRCAASRGSAGLASCYRPRPLRQSGRRCFACRGGLSGLNKALPHDSLTTTTQLFE